VAAREVENATMSVYFDSPEYAKRKSKASSPLIIASNAVATGFGGDLRNCSISIIVAFGPGSLMQVDDFPRDTQNSHGSQIEG